MVSEPGGFAGFANVATVEVTVGTDQHLSEALRHAGERFLQQLRRPLARTLVAGSIAHGQALPRPRERGEQHAVRPAALVVEIGPFLLHAVERLDVPIQVHHGHALLPFALVRKLPLHLVLNGIDRLSKSLETPRGEPERRSAAESRPPSSGSGSGTRPASALPPSSCWSEAWSSRHSPPDVQVERLREHVVRFVKGKMDLQHLYEFIDLLSDAKPLQKRRNQSEPSIGRHRGTRINLQVKPRKTHHPTGSLRPGVLFFRNSNASVDVTRAREGGRLLHSGE